ncbi:MAG TPA: hypothetical protein VIP30_13780 [Stenotrophomonas sp.]
MEAAIDRRSPLGALGPSDIEQALADPNFAEALLIELDDACLAVQGACTTDAQQRMLATSIRLARQIYLDHLRRQRSFR